MWAVATMTFLMLRIVPGDPIDLMAVQMLDQSGLDRMREEWGLDQPIWRQYLTFMTGLVRGDLGVSIRSGVPVVKLLAEKMPPTIELALVAMFIGTIIGVVTGIVSAITKNRGLDYGVRSFAMLGFSVPWFWIALMLVIVFGVMLKWFPVSGRIEAGMSYETITNFMLIDHVITGNWPALLSFLRHLTLPALAIGFTSAGFVSRMTRSSMLEIIREDYVRSARAKGLANRVVTVRHALPNAILPVITLVGLQFGALLGGAVITELVFAWPGLGRMLLGAILSRDYPVVQGTVIFVAMAYVLMNLAVDILYRFVDPRLRNE
jgi:peptide/nickel transport system permease protein